MLYIPRPDNRLCLIGLILLAVALNACGGEAAVPESVPKLVLIGIDGGTWNVIDPMLEAGELPHLEALRQRGVTAELKSVIPLSSPTVWTSIATGRRPKAHGVTFFYSNWNSIQVPTLWERFAAAGLRVGLYDYLITWPPPSLPDGFVVPGWLRRDESVTPTDLWQRLGLPPYFLEYTNVDSLEAFNARIVRETTEKARYWNRLAEEFDPDVGAVTFYAMDAMSHLYWSATYPEDFGQPPTGFTADPRYAGVIRDTMRGIDRSIGEIINALGPEANVVIASDHGFKVRKGGVEQRWNVHARKLLSLAGIEPEHDGVTMIVEDTYIALRIDSGPAAEREATLVRVRDQFAALRGPDGEPLLEIDTVHVPPLPAEWKPDRPRRVTVVVERDQPAHAFFFASPRPEILSLLSPEDEVDLDGERFRLHDLIISYEYSGGHKMTGIFLAAGSLIRHRARRVRLSVLDIAPLMTYLAGQPIPDDLEGKFPKRLIDAKYLRRFPPRSIPALEAPRLPEEDEPVIEGVDDREIDKRLRTLGYL